jgi:hypothetical protein
MEGLSTQLQQLVNILSSKKIYSVIVIGTPDASGHIFQNFDPPLEFDSSITYTCSLLTLNASSLFPNIVENRNNALYYSVANSAEVKTVKFDTGCYNVEDLDKHIQDVLGAEDGTPRIKLELNQGSGKSTLKLKAGYKVYFKDRANTFADLLGFDNVDLAEPANTSARMVDLVKDLLIFVSVDCVEGSTYNGKQTQILFSFLNNIKWGHPINIIAKYPEEHVLRKTNKISRMTFSFTNQDGAPATFMGTKVSLKMLIKQV